MKDEHQIISIGQIDLDPTSESTQPNLMDLLVLPMRDLVLFPAVTIPITVGREHTLQTVKFAAEHKLPIGVFCQLDPATEHPALSDLHPIGVLADVVRVLELPDGTNTAIISARGKIKITGPGLGAVLPGALSVSALPVRETSPRGAANREYDITVSEIKSTTLALLRRESDAPNDLIYNIENVPKRAILLNLIATHLPLPSDEKIQLLRINRLKDRASRLLFHLSQIEKSANIKEEINKKAQKNLGEQQRRAILQQQYDALRDELFGDEDQDINNFQEKAAKISWPDDVKATFLKELDKLRRLNPQSPDYSVQYTYLTLLTDLPWGINTPLNPNFAKAEATLEADHYGLEKVKERILEQLAVMMNTPDGRSPIICLVGAPGVGKTSLGQSIARALGRNYQRISLGGLHDESEIRGHRKTYIGAMPGRIIDALKRAKSNNPVLLLDEIDKTGRDVKGDPSAALLEVLDPEQNSHFHDNYVDVDYDLSRVLFIATANTLSTIPQPLLDRMEVIDISGYLIEEKIEIARRHLIPRIAVENGFATDEITVTPQAITAIIEGYTSESGVRQLEQNLRKIVRKIVLNKMRALPYDLTVDTPQLRNLLGIERFTPERYETDLTPGVAVGLAWTAVGGEILFIESAFTPGKAEKLTITGNLGDVMKESAVIATQIARARADKYSIPADYFDCHQLHIHVPEGAIPKDGPSAGITLATSILSAATGRHVRPNLAMTGEITLRGKVLPVGGIKEKILAAKRAGITDIILCNANRKDIEDIRPAYLNGLTFHYVSTIDDVLQIALQ